MNRVKLKDGRRNVVANRGGRRGCEYGEGSGGVKEWDRDICKNTTEQKKETKKKIQNLKVCINSKRVDLYDDCSGRKKIAFGCFICRQTGSNAFVPR